MNYSAPRGLRTIGVDLRDVARERGAHRPMHPLLPEPVLAFTRHWLALSGAVAPMWQQFDMLDVGEIAPYLTIVRSERDGMFTFQFTGSAVSAILGEDLTGRSVTSENPILGEIDWYRRFKPVAETADIQVATGTTNPPYTSSIDFVAADFPFLSDSSAAVTHIVGLTVARLN